MLSNILYIYFLLNLLVSRVLTIITVVQRTILCNKKSGAYPKSIVVQILS